MNAPVTTATVYSLHPIPTLRSSYVLRDGRYVGILFPPRGGGVDWEVFPDIQDTGGLPDGDRGIMTRRFPDEAGALSFLGISAETAA